MTITTYAFQGAGKLYLREYGASAGLVPVGNCSKLELTVEEDVKKMQDYQDPAGGTAATARQIKNVSIALTAHEITPENLARATLGDVREVTGSTVVNEAHTAYQGAIVQTAQSNISAVTVKAVAGSSKTVTLAQTAGTATATCSAHGFLQGQKVLIAGADQAGYNGEKTILTKESGTFTFAVAADTVTPATGTITATLTTYYTPGDYEVLPGGIWIPVGSAITEASSLQISYTYANSDVVEALTSSALIWQLYFEGLNVADSARPVMVRVHKAQLGSAKNISLIGTDMVALEFAGDVLKDNTIVTSGLSKFFQVIQQAA
jgi:hypothetical protein